MTWEYAVLICSLDGQTVYVNATGEGGTDMASAANNAGAAGWELAVGYAKSDSLVHVFKRPT